MTGRHNSLAGKTAIVTGASQGIGHEIALALADRGVHLHLTAREASNVASTAQLARDQGVQAHGYGLDLGKPEEIVRFHGAVSSRTTSIDVLINNAGAYGRAPVAEDDGSILGELLRVNVEGTYALTRAFLPALVAAQGDIVFVNSSITRSLATGIAQFASSQHALLAITNALRSEVNQRGVRVLSVFPGRTATPRQERIFEIEEKPYEAASLLQPSDVAEMVIASISLPDTAEVTDIHIRPKAP